MIRLLYDVLVDATELDTLLKEWKVQVQGISTVEDLPPAKLTDKDGKEVDDPDSPTVQTIVSVNDKISESDKQLIDEGVKACIKTAASRPVAVLEETLLDEKRELT